MTPKVCSRGNKLEEVFWAEFANNPAALKRVLASILNATKTATAENAPVLPEDELTEAAEGQLLTRIHRYREQTAAIVKHKKAS
ncbi:hypothetical protein [Pseudorhodobacter wandonensis]|uniref:hypothetical protein n=1 Tax=Pseudorhodobacter wandonensis TaxID=1120568 RepID=UPI00067D6917|nr:hypothetical protein [Pseudorhodobacter wandonensis]